MDKEYIELCKDKRVIERFNFKVTNPNNELLPLERLPTLDDLFDWLEEKINKNEKPYAIDSAALMWEHALLKFYCWWCTTTPKGQFKDMKTALLTYILKLV